MSAFLGQVRLGGWRPAYSSRLGQIDWTPIEAEAWLKQVTPGLRVYPECSNAFVDRTKQIVAALEGGSIQYDDLIPIGSSELALKKQIDTCLSEKKAAKETQDKRTEVVAIIGAMAVALGLGYWILS